MKIINLVEDTQGASGAEFEHGLSFYIETPKHKLLSDAGATDMFIRNADLLGVRLETVDTLILSHGHYDHSGGIMPFVKLNPTAKIYMRSNAGGEYYHDERYIGIDKEILKLPQVVLTEDLLEIDDELSLFSGIRGNRLRPRGNKLLSEFVEDVQLLDRFTHEQCLVISAEGKKILVSGCAHNGILNVLDRYAEIYGGAPDEVVSGFHMMKKGDYTAEEIAEIKETAELLTKLPTRFHSGHCTGKPAFDIMKKIMGEQLCEIHSGDTVL